MVRPRGGEPLEWGVSKGPRDSPGRPGGPLGIDLVRGRLGRGWSGLKLHLGAVGDVTADFNYMPFLAAVVHLRTKMEVLFRLYRAEACRLLITKQSAARARVQVVGSGIAAEAAVSGATMP